MVFNRVVGATVEHFGDVSPFILMRAVHQE